MWRDYLQLTKPGMVLGNLLPAVAGFFLAAKGKPDWALFFWTILGLALVIAAACAFNNYLDREIDTKMKRTSRRALVRGAVKPSHALAFACSLLAGGTAILDLFTNGLALAAALVGFFGYVFVYGYFKRRTSWGTLIGSVPGAMPPVVGYTAVSGQLDGAVLALFLVLAFWQMPHFFAIAIFRRSDYAAAKLPVLSVKRGIAATKRQIMVYMLAFVLCAPLLSLLGYAGWVYLIVAVGMGLFWLGAGWRGYQAHDEAAWARRMFGYSLWILLLFSAVVTLNAWLP